MKIKIEPFNGIEHFEYSGTEEEFVKEKVYRRLYGLIDGSPAGVAGMLKRDLDLTFPGRYTFTWTADVQMNDDGSYQSPATLKRFIYYINVYQDKQPFFSIMRDFQYEEERNLFAEDWDNYDEVADNIYRLAIQKQYGIKLYM